MIIHQTSCSVGIKFVFTIPNDRKYEIKITKWSSTYGYAECVIKDCKTGESYETHGRIVLNGHSIVTKWQDTYDDSRKNWVPSKNMIVLIDE